MRKFTLISAAAALLLLSTSVVVAQPSMLSALLRFVGERQQAVASFIVSLNLTPAQQAQANALQQSAKNTRMDALLAASITAQQVKRDLQDPKADLHQTAQLVQATVDTQLAAHRALTAQRLSFYDSLNATQQAQVRAQMVQRIERLERLRQVLLDFASDGI
jgi:LTXXQ motif family protein